MHAVYIFVQAIFFGCATDACKREAAGECNYSTDSRLFLLTNALGNLRAFCMRDADWACIFVVLHTRKFEMAQLSPAMLG
jgi:hypothetical protein